MTRAIEQWAKRHFSENDGPFMVQKLTGGISSEIYRVEATTHNPNFLPVVLTILRDPNEWWKIEKEQLIRDLVKNDPDVLLPELIDFGFDKISGSQVAFLISEFINGGDLDFFLSQELTKRDESNKLAGLAKDLGFRIGSLHKHQAGIYGLVGYTPEQYNSWEAYIISEFHKEIMLINQLNPNLQIGRVKVSNLQKLIPSLEHMLGSLQSSLKTDVSLLSHGDARFGNFMANKNKKSDWKITSMIDIEAMLGGDPEIDIAFMENWLHFSGYKQAFYAQKNKYEEGYKKSRKPSLEYPRKRFIYHIVRSLAYLRTVFEFNIEEFVRADHRHVKYVEQHMEIIESLAKGNYLEDLGIKPLV